MVLINQTLGYSMVGGFFWVLFFQVVRASLSFSDFTIFFLHLSKLLPAPFRHTKVQKNQNFSRYFNHDLGHLYHLTDYSYVGFVMI